MTWHTPDMFSIGYFTVIPKTCVFLQVSSDAYYAGWQKSVTSQYRKGLYRGLLIPQIHKGNTGEMNVWVVAHSLLKSPLLLPRYFGISK